MDLTDTEIKIKKLASGLGLIQGLAWTIMSLLCIIYYHSSDTPSSYGSYMDLVGIEIYSLFLFTNEEVFEGQSLTGNVFDGFMFIYFFLDIVWMGASVQMLRKNEVKLVQYWSYWTLAVSFWDALTFIILGADYGKCLSFAKKYAYGDELMSMEALCATAILPVFVIAAKGFTLWLLNICLATFLLQITKRVK